MSHSKEIARKINRGMKTTRKIVENYSKVLAPKQKQTRQAREFKKATQLVINLASKIP